MAAFLSTLPATSADSPEPDDITKRCGAPSRPSSVTPATVSANEACCWAPGKLPRGCRRVARADERERADRAPHTADVSTKASTVLTVGPSRLRPSWSRSLPGNGPTAYGRRRRVRILGRGGHAAYRDAPAREICVRDERQARRR